MSEIDAHLKRAKRSLLNDMENFKNEEVNR
jgi:hypothetical protein